MNKIKTTLPLALLVAASFTLTITTAAAEERRPNIVMILADDLGWSDNTLYGTTSLYQTPNLERLAERGMLFTRAYSASPLCSPTRASVMTGQSCARSGHTAPEHHLPACRLRPEVAENAPPGNKALQVATTTRLDTNLPTLGQMLGSSGYRTAHFGKWHLGPSPFSPLEHGFEIDIPHWAGPGPGGNFVAPWAYRDFQPNSPNQHIEDRMAYEAVKWMETVKDEAFYLQFWQFSVHAPFDAKEELISYYREKIDVTAPQRSPTYAAMVHSLDDAVGTLLDAIDRLGIADRTIVIFSSDNGGNMYNGIKEIGPDGQSFVTAPTSNAPLRGGKATVFEGGIRVPQVIVWPNVTKAGSRTDVVTQTTDFYPTVLSAAGIPLPQDYPIDGVDIRPLLEGKSFERGPIYTYFPHAPGVPDWLPPSIAVHLDRWKLIRLFHQGDDGAHDYLLYDLDEDIGESTNLAEAMPEKVKELDSIIQNHLDETNAVVPLPNPRFRRAAYKPEEIGVQVGGLKMSPTREQRLARTRSDAPPAKRQNQAERAEAESPLDKPNKAADNQAHSAAKPNIIIVFTDDQGWTDLGIHGVDPDVRTANIDQLARDGVLFTKGYTTAPQCVPSRAGIITGRHQNAFGMEDNHKGPLPLSEITIADRLRDAGYVTGMIGKWHLNPGPNRLFPDGQEVPDAKYDPGNRGFEEYWNGPMVNYQTNFDLEGNLLPNAPQPIKDPRFRIVVQTEAALAFLKRRETDERPFFLYLAYFAPHAPMQASEPHMQRMAHVKQSDRRMGLSSILAMDDGIGEIRKKLDEMGIAENTLIFYISDNGAPLRDGAYVGSFNTPMVGEKGMQTDGGQRVPFIAAWPGTIPAGQRFQWPVWTLDATATSLAAGGAPLDDKIEGVDLLPYLVHQRPGPVHDYLSWRWRSQSSILTGDGKWKFLRLGSRDRYLFDMTAVGHETEEHNRIAEYSELATELENKLAQVADTWQTKGLPTKINEQDQKFFDFHVKTKRRPAITGPLSSYDVRPKKGVADPDDNKRENKRDNKRENKKQDSSSLQGWLLRNGSEQFLPDTEGGGLAFKSESPRLHTFLARRFQPPLLPPVKVEIEARSAQTNTASLSWVSGRIGSDDFVQQPPAEFSLTAGKSWQTLSTEIRAEQSVPMIRLFLSDQGKPPIELRSIRLTDQGGRVEEFNFEKQLASSIKYHIKPGEKSNDQ